MFFLFTFNLLPSTSFQKKILTSTYHNISWQDLILFYTLFIYLFLTITDFNLDVHGVIATKVERCVIKLRRNVR